MCVCVQNERSLLYGMCLKYSYIVSHCCFAKRLSVSRSHTRTHTHTHTHTATSPVPVVGRQISAFDIKTLKFSEFNDKHNLVSCGKHNIRYVIIIVIVSIIIVIMIIIIIIIIINIFITILTI